MKANRLRTLFIVAGLIVVTVLAIAYAKDDNTSTPIPKPPTAAPIDIQGKNGVVSLNGRLTQNKVFAGGDRTVSLALTLKADEVIQPDTGQTQHVDLVVVLDRSGSMDGVKIQHAKKAVRELLDRLTPKDRIALVSYSDYVKRHTRLLEATPANRSLIENEIQKLESGGATNLGGGLEEGIKVVTSSESKGNISRVILISDGLANRGVTDPKALGQMAATAAKREFAVSTVGVGQDFNEYLMTAIADRGAGNYYYMENPAAFARIFEKEFKNAATAVATAVNIRVPLDGGWTLVNASGFPIENSGNTASIQPGALRSGQTRTLYLTLKTPEGEGNYQLAGLSVDFSHNGQKFSVTLDQPFEVAVVKDKKKAVASVKKAVWEKKVIQEDYNKLQEEVAKDIKNGDEKGALGRIETYYREQQAINEAVKSDEVTSNLENDLDDLRQNVRDTFTGAPAEVQMKQKTRSKAMQHEGYSNRRAKQLK